MIAQGALPFQFEVEKPLPGMTALGGLPAYLDLAVVSGLVESIRRRMKVCAGKQQGWKEEQILVSLILLNLIGGESVEDLRVLEGDDGFSLLLKRVEWHGLPRAERRELERRWRKEKERVVPSPSSVFRYLASFHDEQEEAKRKPGKAFIPSVNDFLKGLYQVNWDMLRFVQNKLPATEATLDMDATLIETNKRNSLYGYKGFKAFQPLNVYWHERNMLLYSEFRDGNVPAGYEQLRVLMDALEGIPEGIEKIYLRTDTAGYEQELLRYCAEGKNERFKVIEFAIGVDVTKEFKRAVAEVEENDWHIIYKEKNGKQEPTKQQWAEVCFVPNWIGRKKSGPEYRFLAIREPLEQPSLPGLGPVQLPFPTMEFSRKTYKVFGLVTNRTLPGQELIEWHRQRCGKSEEAHSVMKSDLAGGKLPSADFGENAAWWAIMILAFNLNAIMRLLVLPKEWAGAKLKRIRFCLIHLAGRVVEHSRRLIVRLANSHPFAGLLVEMRQHMLALAQAPPG